jgi:hypothetical protein
MIILDSQAPIDPTEYLYYKAFQWLNLVCCTPAEVSPEVSVQTTKAPPIAPCCSQESPLLYPLVPN